MPLKNFTKRWTKVRKFQNGMNLLMNKENNLLLTMLIKFLQIWIKKINLMFLSKQWVELILMMMPLLLVLDLRRMVLKLNLNAILKLMQNKIISQFKKRFQECLLQRDLLLQRELNNLIKWKLQPQSLLVFKNLAKNKI